jgi:hypothetical protein
LVGWGGLTPLHLAARSVEIEEDTGKALQQKFPEDEVSDNRFELENILVVFLKR